MDNIEIKVKLFALYREVAGISEVILRVPSGTTVGEILDKISEKYQLVTYRKDMMIAVNREYVSEKTMLKHKDEIEILPPVSGG